MPARRAAAAAAHAATTLADAQSDW